MPFRLQHLAQPGEDLPAVFAVAHVVVQLGSGLRGQAAFDQLCQCLFDRTRSQRHFELQPR